MVGCMTAWPDHLSKFALLLRTLADQVLSEKIMHLSLGNILHQAHPAHCPQPLQTKPKLDAYMCMYIHTSCVAHNSFIDLLTD